MVRLTELHSMHVRTKASRVDQSRPSPDLEEIDDPDFIVRCRKIDIRIEDFCALVG
jgi:hypothetical protein